MSAEIHLAADLTFSVDGPDGSSTGRIVADGSRVVVLASDPVATISAAFGARAGNGSRAPAALADFLSDVGVTVELAGPRGRVLTVGAGVHSSVGAIVGGTPHVRLESARAARSLLVARVSPTSPARRRLMAGVAGAALFAVLRRLRTRRPLRRA